MKTVIYTFIIICSLLLQSCGEEKVKAPRVKKGYIDLSSWDFENDGNVKLIGDWEFYWNKLLTPQDLKKHNVKNAKGFLKHPTLWNGKVVNGVRLNKYGYATYRLRVKLPKSNLSLGLKAVYSLSNHKVFVDGKALILDGVVGKSKEETTPSNKSKYVFFKNGSNEIEIVVQTSNFSMAKGGSHRAFEIGFNKCMQADKDQDFMLDAFILGSIFIMGIYHLILYFLRRREGTPLYFGIFCMAMAFRSGFTGNSEIWYNLLPEISWTSVKRITYIALFCAPPSILTFICIMNRNRFSKFLPHIFWIVTGLFSFVTLVTSPKLFSELIGIYQLLTLIQILLSMGLLFHAVFKKILLAIPLTVGGFLFSAAAVHDILLTKEVIVGPELTHLGLYAFIIMQALVISVRFSKAFIRAEMAQQKNQLLQDVDQQKTKFFQSISHELRTPLTLILNPLSKIRKAQPENEELQSIEENSKKLHKLVNQLLDFQKVTYEVDELKLTQIEVRDFLTTISNGFKTICEDKNIKLILDLKESSNVVIRAQVDALEKIMFNYFSNAYKFTPVNGAISISIKNYPDKVRINVKDNGPGIKEENRDKLFHLFSTLEDESSHELKGSGLGLAITKELAKSMGGDVGVDLKNTFGCTFWVEFPISKNLGKVIDILIVDDEPAILDVFHDMIRKELPHLNFELASSFTEALELVQKYCIKIVLTDAILPDHSGLELLKETYRIQPESKRYLITGQANEKLLQEAINSKKVEHIFYKPPNQDEIIPIIAGALKSSHSAPIQTTNIKDQLTKLLYFDLEDKKAKTKEISEEADESDDSERILIVDDLPNMIHMIDSVLNQHGYSTLYASNGVEALKVLNEKEVDLVVSDWMMPEMDGLELLKTLRKDKNFSTIPVVLLTAKSDDENKLIGQHFGASAFLGKPFNEIELISVVQNLLKLKQKEKIVAQLNKNLTEHILKRYLPPKMIEKVLEGENLLEQPPQVLPITVVNMDLYNFASYIKKLGPLKMGQVLNEYLSIMNKIALDHGATIDKFYADEITVFFGAPEKIPSEKQVESAQKCITELINAFKPLRSKWEKDLDIKLDMRFSVHQDIALVGHMGSSERSEYTAIGDAINVTSNIKDLVKGGELIYTSSILNFLPNSDWENAEISKSELYNKGSLFTFKI